MARMVRPLPATKVCHTCGLEQDTSAFYVHRNATREWLSSNCRPCYVQGVTKALRLRMQDPEARARRNAYNAAWWKAHPEQRNAKGRRHHHRDKARRNARRAVRAKAWRMAHPEEGRARSRLQYRKLWAYHQAYRRQWNLQNRERYLRNTLQAAKRRRARKAQAPINDLTHRQWAYIQSMQNHRCAYCGVRCKGKLTQDHIIPLSKGGSHTLSNIIGACASCNAKKGAGAPLKPVQPILL